MIGPSPTARVSAAAISCAIASGAHGRVELASILYRHNRFPASAGWRRGVPHAAAARDWLLASEALACELPAQGWRRNTAPPSAAAWIAWCRTDGPPPHHPHKLYVCPSPARTATALDRALPILFTSNAVTIKVAAQPLDLLRPDKLVGHFASADDVRAAAEQLAPALADVGAQPVPFTEALDACGILSAAVDPPPNTFVGRRRARSWREWITLRLATHIVAARGKTGDAREIHAVVLRRIERDGVDASRWSAVAPRWRGVAVAR